MRPTSTRISTVVRSKARLAAVRAWFAVGGALAPGRVIREAADLFCTPFASTRTRARSAPLGDAREDRVDCADAALQLYVWGDPQREPYVLLAHGWSSHGTRFLPWVRALRARGYAAVAFDHVAHGRSGGRRANFLLFIDGLMAVAQRFGPAAAVVGHSMGGGAAAAALARGLQAERAVLVAPAADLADALARFARLTGLAEPLFRRMLAMFESTLHMRFDDLQAHRTAPSIGRPALIVHDLADREVPWSEGERWARYWPQARLMSTHGLGHNRILDDDAVIDAALRFIDGETVGDRVVSTHALPFGFA